MARPQKRNADYFPHDHNLRNEKRVKALRSKYGVEGYAVYLMLLENLVYASGFTIPFADEIDLELLAGDFDIESNELEAIIGYMIRLKLLIKQDGLLYSTDLVSSLQPLLEYREKERKRKTSDKTGKKVLPQEKVTKQGVFHPENGVFHAENFDEEGVFRMENPTSKVKYSKVEKRKEKYSDIGGKEKEEKEKKIPPKNLKFEEGLDSENPANKKEKSCAKKESEQGAGDQAIFSPGKVDDPSPPGSPVSQPLHSRCKEYFQELVPAYYWEDQDDGHLQNILKKLQYSFRKTTLNDERLYQAFVSFLAKIPDFWREKKFTIYQISQYYNDIVNEIIQLEKKQNQASGNTGRETIKPRIKLPPKEKPKKPGDEEKQREVMVNNLGSIFDSYCEHGKFHSPPNRVIYNFLLEEGIITASPKSWLTWEAKAVEIYQQRLGDEDDQDYQENRQVLADFESAIRTYRYWEFRNVVKEVALQEYFEQWRKQGKNLKQLINQNLNKNHG